MAEQVGIEPSITWEHHYGTIQLIVQTISIVDSISNIFRKLERLLLPYLFHSVLLLSLQGTLYYLGQA